MANLSQGLMVLFGMAVALVLLLVLLFSVIILPIALANVWRVNRAKAKIFAALGLPAEANSPRQTVLLFDGPEGCGAVCVAQRRFLCMYTNWEVTVVRGSYPAWLRARIAEDGAESCAALVAAAALSRLLIAQYRALFKVPALGLNVWTHSDRLHYWFNSDSASTHFNKAGVTIKAQRILRTFIDREIHICKYEKETSSADMKDVVERLFPLWKLNEVRVKTKTFEMFRPIKDSIVSSEQ